MMDSRVSSSKEMGPRIRSFVAGMKIGLNMGKPMI
jgi:hypothetical protein